jgi:hypothetical protein
MNKNNKTFSQAQLKILQDIIKRDGYLKSNDFNKLKIDFNILSNITFKKELTRNKIPFENTDLKNILKTLEVRDTEGVFSLEGFNLLGDWRINLFKNSKVNVDYKCRCCNEKGISRLSHIIQRKFFALEPICAKCIEKEVTNTKEWREVNSKAQLIAQNKPEQLEKNRKAQLKRFGDPEVIKQHSETSKEVWKRPGHLEKMSTIALDKWKNPEYAKKVIENVKSSQQSGIYKEIFYNSGYELAFLLKTEFERGGLNCLRRPDFYISYKRKDGKSSCYYPDFILDDIFLIEVKGYAPWVDLENLSLKNKAAKKWCKKNNLKFRVVDDKDLGGILIKKAKKIHNELKDGKIKK